MTLPVVRFEINIQEDKACSFQMICRFSILLFILLLFYLLFILFIFYLFGGCTPPPPYSPGLVHDPKQPFRV